MIIFWYLALKGEAGYIHCEYQGQSAFYDIFLAILLKGMTNILNNVRVICTLLEKICHPLTPLYLGGKLHSYKLYLVSHL